MILVMPEKALKLTMNDLFRAQLRKTQSDGGLPFGLEMAAGGMAGFTQGQSPRSVPRLSRSIVVPAVSLVLSPGPL